MTQRFLTSLAAALCLSATALAQTVLDGKGALAEFDRGMAAIEAEDFVTARDGLDRACQWGVAVACANLGVLWANGRGGAKDLTKAATLFQTGCDGEYVGERNGGDACFNYGLSLEQGWAGTKDLNEARRYYLKACSLDQELGCFNGGNMQMQGLGGAVNDAGALDSYAKGCELGHGQTCYNAAYLIYQNRAAAPEGKDLAYYKARACELGQEKLCPKK